MNADGGLRGKTALVTGASSGLGRDMAAELARRGCDLIVVARREERLLALKQELEAANGVSVHVVLADLGAENSAQRVYDEVASAGLQVDFLLNNAGFGLKGQFLDIDWEQHRNLVAVDVLAAVQLTGLFLPGMVERNSGRVMLVASTMAYQASPGFATYGAAKGFILLFGEALAHELRKTRVRVTTVSPGMTATEFDERAGQRPSLFQRITRMSSEDVAGECVRAMLKGRASTVIGRRNRVIGLAGQFTPRRFAPAFASLLTRNPREK